MMPPPPSPGGASSATISPTSLALGAQTVETKAHNAPSGSGSAKPPSGSGSLPEMAGVQWEWKSDGAVEAWHTPRPKAPRKDRIYLGRVGVRKLAEWQRLPASERLATVAAWVADRRAGKGL
jgi:hypothetical protein